MENNRGCVAILSAAALIGIGITVGLILTGYRISPQTEFFSLALWPMLAALWVFSPRGLPVLWLISISANFGTWVVYVILGCFLFPRAMWGVVFLTQFPAQDKALGWIVLVVGLILDALEDKLFTNAMKAEPSY